MLVMRKAVIVERVTRGARFKSVGFGENALRTAQTYAACIAATERRLPSRKSAGIVGSDLRIWNTLAPRYKISKDEWRFVGSVGLLNLDMLV